MRKSFFDGERIPNLVLVHCFSRAWFVLCCISYRAGMHWWVRGSRGMDISLRWKCGELEWEWVGMNEGKLEGDDEWENEE